MDLNDERMIREDTLHVGATRPVRFLGLPMPLAVALVGLAYVIQTNVTGWQGVLWAVSVVGPCWGIAYLAVAHDPYGINVGLAWLRTSLLSLDRGRWGGPSCSPLPARLRQGRRRHGP
ncbi:VirB3 family type IV secretion system protein (plasmid) [Skermanella rosea]|uniref:VirB3 family type IV secretion system protein n=1 Tax=Skermanella rosea TaxID=1817965 RepID=UPI001933CD23|nr:VirB3 family type IV secretion system protein [Skermanella rosea]UEM08123.1 VirB3 family type IV secretion system protein [Skermanella rosea]